MNKLLHKTARGGIIKAYRGINKRLARAYYHFVCRKNLKGMALEYLCDANGKTIPKDWVSPDYVCYSAGVGLDSSFDIELAKKYGCKVHLFDPTPESAEYLKGVLPGNPKLVYNKIGLWREDKTLVFFPPFRPGGSHSLYDLHGDSGAFEVICKRVSTIMRELGHDHIDLLKLDIEGAWYPVLIDVINQGISVKILCIESDSPSSPYRAMKILKGLRKLGLVLCHCKGDDLLFVRESLMPA